MEFQKKPSSTEIKTDNQLEPLADTRESARSSSPVRNQSNAVPRLGEPSASSKILVILLIISSLVFITTMSLQLAGSFKEDKSLLDYDVSKTYLIKLDNNETFAGKLKRINDNFFLLEDTYQISNVNKQPFVVKPADGEYGVDDTLYIDSSDVTYWQAIPDDSTLGQLIKNYDNADTDKETMDIEPKNETTKPSANEKPTQPETNTPSQPADADKSTSSNKPNQTTPQNPDSNKNNNTPNDGIDPLQ